MFQLNKSTLRKFNFIVIIAAIILGFLSANNKIINKMDEQQKTLAKNWQQRNQQQKEKIKMVEDYVYNELQNNLQEVYKENVASNNTLVVTYDIKLYQSVKNQIANFLATEYGNRNYPETQERVDWITQNLSKLENEFKTKIQEQDQVRETNLNCFVEINHPQYEDYNKKYKDQLCQQGDLEDIVGPLADYSQVFIRVNSENVNKNLNSLTKIEEFLNANISQEND